MQENHKDARRLEPRCSRPGTLIKEFLWLFFVGTFQCGLAFLLFSAMVQASAGRPQTSIFYGTYHKSIYMLLPIILESGFVSGIASLAYLHMLGCYYIFLRRVIDFRSRAWRSKLKPLFLIQAGTCAPMLLLPLKLSSPLNVAMLFCPVGLWITSAYLYFSRPGKLS